MVYLPPSVRLVFSLSILGFSSDIFNDRRFMMGIGLSVNTAEL